MIKVKMHFVKSTKNKHVYGCLQDGEAIPSLYIEKSALPANPPQVIEVSVDGSE